MGHIDLKRLEFAVRSIAEVFVRHKAGEVLGEKEISEILVTTLDSTAWSTGSC